MWIFRPYTFMKANDNKKGYFDPRPSMSYGCKIVIWIGARRIGKTYSGKKWVLKKVYGTDNKKFVWLRDNDEARKKLAQDNGAKFFSDMKKCSIPEIGSCYIQGETIKGWGRTIGYLMPSSTFQNYKGNDYEDIEYIVFDEFIAEKNTKFNANRAWEIINSIYTVGSTRENIRILMLANALDRGDDFLQFLGVKIKDYGIYVNREKDVCIHYCDDHPEFRKQREISVIGKLIKGTEFEENLFNNKFSDDEKQFFDKKPSKSKLLFIAHSLEQSARVYYYEDMLYVSKDGNLDTRGEYRFVSNFKAVNTKLNLIPDTFFIALKEAVKQNRVLYQNAFCKSVIFNFLDKK